MLTGEPLRRGLGSGQGALVPSPRAGGDGIHTVEDPHPTLPCAGTPWVKERGRPPLLGSQSPQSGEGEETESMGCWEPTPGARARPVTAPSRRNLQVGWA